VEEHGGGRLEQLSGHEYQAFSTAVAQPANSPFKPTLFRGAAEFRRSVASYVRCHHAHGAATALTPATELKSA
jgi:hypothetical protein